MTYRSHRDSIEEDVAAKKARGEGPRSDPPPIRAKVVPATKFTLPLKPCPFCGADAHFDGSRLGRKVWVYCFKCKTRTPVCVNSKEAIRLWNTRVQPVERGDEIIDLPDKEAQYLAQLDDYYRRACAGDRTVFVRICLH